MWWSKTSTRGRERIASGTRLMFRVTCDCDGIFRGSHRITRVACRVSLQF